MVSTTYAQGPKLRDRGLPPPPLVGDHTTLYDHPYAAYYIGKSAFWLRRKVALGELPPELTTRIGRSILFTGDQLVRVIAHFAQPAPQHTYRRRSPRHRATTS